MIFASTFNQSFSLDGSQGLKIARLRITNLSEFASGAKIAITRIPAGIYIHQIKLLARNANGFAFDLGCFQPESCDTPAQEDATFFLNNYLINTDGCMMPPCCSWSCGNPCSTDCCPALPSKDGCATTPEKRWENPLMVMTVRTPVTAACAELTLVIEYQ
ncbi:MAG: hypothetical protein ACK4RS_06450 [Thiothrix sp.]